jgi:hypothetical protein
MKPSNTPRPRLVNLEPAEDDDGPRPQVAEAKRRGRPRSAKAKAKAKGGRFADLNAFVDFTAGTLERSELLVWLTLFRDCRDGIARTGQADIARRTRLAERTVRHAIRRLAKLELLEIVRRGGVSAGPSTYRLRPLEPARTTPEPPAK